MDGGCVADYFSSNKSLSEYMIVFLSSYIVVLLIGFLYLLIEDKHHPRFVDDPCHCLFSDPVSRPVPDRPVDRHHTHDHFWQISLELIRSLFRPPAGHSSVSFTNIGKPFRFLYFGGFNLFALFIE
jgi:hypothetical protein